MPMAGARTCCAARSSAVGRSRAANRAWGPQLRAECRHPLRGAIAERVRNLRAMADGNMKTQVNDPAKNAPLQQIAALLHGASGIDFRLYKRNTIERRARRRMRYHNLDDLAAYAHRLEADPVELNAL